MIYKINKTSSKQIGKIFKFIFMGECKMDINPISSITDFKISSSELSPPPKKSRRFALQAILAYLRLGYYLFFIPFRCDLNKGTECYEMTETRLKKVVAVIYDVFHTFMFFMTHSCMVIIALKTSGGYLNPVKMSQAVIDISYIFVFHYVFLFKKAYFQQFFNLVQKSQTRDNGKVTPNTRMNLLFWGIVLFVYLFLLPLPAYQSWVDNRVDAVIKVVTGLPENLNYSSQDRFKDCGWNITRSLSSFLFNFVRAIGESPSVLLFLFGIYLKELCEDLRVRIEDGNISCSEILERHLHIKEVNNCIGSITGGLIFIFVIGSVPFIAESVIHTNLPDAMTIAGLLIGGNSYLLCMLGSAEANKEAKKLRTTFVQYSYNRQLKLGESNRNEDTISLAILSEFTNTDVGLKGWDFFLVSYSFMGVMLSQIIVYALIIKQEK